MSNSKHKFIVALAMVIMLGLMAPLMAQVQCVPGTPAGCTTNFISIGITVVNPPSALVHNGDPITYSVTVVNPDVPGFCNVVNATVWFLPPNPDGSAPDLASGPPPPAGAILLDQFASFPRGSSLTYTAAYGAGGPNTGAPLVITAAANPTIIQVQAGAVVAGQSETQVQCSPARAQTQIPVTVLQPCIEITKDASPLVVKCTPPDNVVTYTIRVRNCSTNGTQLASWSVIDTLLGDITSRFPGIPAPGQTVTAVIPYTMGTNPADRCAEATSLINVVTVTAQDVLGGARGTVTDTDDATVRIVHPCCTVTKTCDPPSGTPVVPGQVITYTITVTNCGDVAMTNVQVVDSLLGLVGTVASLAPGGTATLTVTREVLESDAPLLCNAVRVTFNPEGFPQQTHECRSDGCCHPVVSPCIRCEKTPDTDVSKADDVINYRLCVINCGTVALDRLSVVDSLLGDKSADFNAAGPLAAGASRCLLYSYTVQPGDADPLVNVMTVGGTAVGTSIQAPPSSCRALVDLVHPDFTITKTCEPPTANPGDTITWTVTVCNTGDVSLDIHVTDAVAGIDETVTVAARTCVDIVRRYLVTEADCDSTITNTASAYATITGGILPNRIPPEGTRDSNSCSVTIPPCGGPTRTPGYWFTHPNALIAGMRCNDGGPFDLDGTVNGRIVLCASGCSFSANDAMSSYWKFQNIKPTACNRPTLVQQIFSAMFNQCLLGTSAPAGIIQDGIDVLCNPAATSAEIAAVIYPLDVFNNSGEPLPLPPAPWVGNADPAKAKLMSSLGTVQPCVKCNK